MFLRPLASNPNGKDSFLRYLEPFGMPIFDFGATERYSSYPF
jgi:hypothetical protein